MECRRASSESGIPHRDLGGMRETTSFTDGETDSERLSCLRAPVANAGQSRDSAEACLPHIHPVSPCYSGRQSCSPKASSDHLKICTLTQCHPDLGPASEIHSLHLVCSNSWASLRNPFTPPEKLRLCQGLPQSTAGFLNFDVLSLSRQRWGRIRLNPGVRQGRTPDKDRSKLALENRREAEALAPADSIFLLDLPFASSRTSHCLLLQAQLPNLENEGSRIVYLSNIITLMIKRSHGNSQGVPQQENG